MMWLTYLHQHRPDAGRCGLTRSYSDGARPLSSLPHDCDIAGSADSWTYQEKPTEFLSGLEAALNEDERRKTAGNAIEELNKKSLYE
jgi:hypothetical protein